MSFHSITQRLKDDITTLSKIIDHSQPGYTRRPFTKWHYQSRDWLKRELENCGLDTRIDAASNLIGIRKGTNPELPPIMIGSHTDSVIGGGRFDGMIGVLAGIEIARQLEEENILLNHTLLIVDFTAEEASEFGISTIGSRGMVGSLSEEVLKRENLDGLTLKEGLEKAGGRPQNLSEEALKKGDLSLYLELHIEQGPVLEQKDKDLGVVTGIVGIRRFKVKIKGQPNHAGTTPMNMRYDALTAASELILGIESITSNKYVEEVVGTVGRIMVEPNSANVVPGFVEIEYEVRSLDIEILDKVINKIEHKIEDIKNKRKVEVVMIKLSASDAIIVDPLIIEGLEKSCRKLGDTMRLPSGAGHDGNHLASITDVGMIFVPSKDGKSHCPEEWTDYEQVTKGVMALKNAILHFDNQH